LPDANAESRNTGKEKRYVAKGAVLMDKYEVPSRTAQIRLKALAPLTLVRALAVAGCMTAVLFAQSTNSGDFRGTVTDPTGAVVPGATVTVTNVETGVTKDYTTNADGLYDTFSILPGHYRIVFSK
jgi:hypothetical protein